jgi:hypothetical protein
VGDRVFARSSFVAQQLQQRRLSAGAVRYYIRREWAVRRLFVLRMANHGTLMHAAIETSPANVPAVERPFEPGSIGGIERRLNIVPLITRQSFLNTTAIALRGHGRFAVPAQARVTRPGADVLATGQQIPAELLTAPAVFVVRLATELARLFLAAEARLLRAHQVARRTWPGVTLEGAKMRARLARFGAGLAARMRRHTGCRRSGINILATPAVVCGGFVRELRIAPGTPP